MVGQGCSVIMKFEFHVYLHQDNSKLDKLLRGQAIIMAKVDELNEELVQINETTNEIAGDMDDLISKVGDGSISSVEAEAIKTQLVALKERLTGIASTHTP